MSSERFHQRGGEAVRVEYTAHPPKATIFCRGTAAFRSRLARDLACLLDVDSEVEGWECQPFELAVGDTLHTPDFLVTYVGGARWLLDASDAGGDPDVTDAATSRGFNHRYVARDKIETGYRLRNARDLLRYGSFRCPLGDRIRVMAALDEVGSFTVAEGLGLFREGPPMAGLASLVLQRILSLELDDALISPDTLVRRADR
ncbi:MULTISPECIES: hypothetical protein [Agrobacterium]|uniref:hypothetical protein n=1 Tax=Agrobacterium tumefaciens TaxID=358 RepID=UPI0015720480|nr:hypothetical protein [Agrobacterium tumefaciens]NSZ06334.1 hypothetical protein [Agrobacterium tumefaciens]